MDDLFNSPLAPFGPGHMPDANPVVELQNQRDKLAEAQRRIEKLEQQVARLSTLCGALAEHNGLSGEELAAAVAAVEKKRKEVFHCAHCGKTLQRAIAKCIYCGAANPHVASAMP